MQSNWNRNNPVKVQEYIKKSREKNPISYLLTKARERCKVSGVEFSILKEDIIIPEFCPLLGTKLVTVLGSGYNPNNLSLDRIDPSKGYVKGNVQVLSRKANIMKQDATKEELITFARRVLELFA